MTVFVECLISMMLVISPVTDGMEGYLPTTWLYDKPFMGGICNKMEGANEATILINAQHQLIVTYNQMQYLIPLPPNAVTWLTDPALVDEFRLYYILGEQFARIGDRYKVMVRISLKDPI